MAWMIIIHGMINEAIARRSPAANSGGPGWSCNEHPGDVYTHSVRVYHPPPIPNTRITTAPSA